MGQLVFSNVPVEGWIIDPDIHGLHDGASDVMRLLTHKGESVHPFMMICVFDMTINGVRTPEMFLKPFPQSPGRFH